MSQPESILSMHNYVDLLSGLPIPSTEQINNFVDYVSRAHSWYKHLPAVPPGSSFFFYLDPFAGLSQKLRSDDHIEVQKREGKGFHYADLPTREYRDRFGYLAYTCLKGTMVSLKASNGDSALQPEKTLGIRTASGQLARLPGEILRAGHLLITAAVYDASRNHGILLARMRHGREDEIMRNTWQATDVGSVAVDKILNRVNEVSSASTKENQPVNYKLGVIDNELNELLKEERRRQLDLMTKAMKNVIGLIESQLGTVAILE